MISPRNCLTFANLNNNKKMNEVRFIYFRVQMDKEENLRAIIDREFKGQWFGSISEVKNKAEALDLCFSGYEDLDEVVDMLNDECYPVEEFVTYCFIH